MQKVISGLFREDRYPGVPIYIITTDAGTLILDCPLYSEDANEFLKAVKELGEPRYIALHDGQRDRVLGVREIDLPIIAHDKTREYMQTWSDTFKGAANPMGGESDSIRRITGVKSAVPEISFSNEFTLHLGSTEIHFLHKPGPTPGAMWVSIPEKNTILIGDAVHISEPPFLGFADIDAWLDTLQELRDAFLKDFRVYSSRDGRIDREDVTNMARFLRKIPVRIERLSTSKEMEVDAESITAELMGDFKIPAAQSERMKLRLKAGLIRLTERLYSIEEQDETD
ncbi:MAG: MBL fold metallo-hydrolase [Anaerolineales bacterium]|nr:MBL fold metallo-hydrolase [Anaerolineales bacterium]